MAKRQYTAADLYGADGRPHAADIQQDKLYNCYFLAPIGTLGEQQPERIQDAIRFNAETGDFTVSLYRPPNQQQRDQGLDRPTLESITVSQSDIRRNIHENGGGTVDNSRDRNGPLWPTVVEAGFAEVYGRDAKGRVNLDQAYLDLGNDQLGGSLSYGTYALTGESGRTVRIESPLAPPFTIISKVPSSSATNSTDKVASPAAEEPRFHAPTMGVRLSMDKAYTEVEQALATGRPVSMSTQRTEVTDGLEERHAYMVMGVSRDPQTNEAQVTLRNPYANNERAGEGNNHNIGEGWNKNNPEITVSLDTLVSKGSFAEFNIGPAARVQTQQQNAPAPAPEQTAPTPTPIPTQNETPQKSTSLGHPSSSDHPFNGLFQQATAHVAKEDQKQGRKPDENSERLALSATALAANSGIHRIDHMVFSVENKERGVKAGENVILVQGGLHDPAHERAHMKTVTAINTPAEQSLQQLDVVHQRQQQQAQTLALQQTPDEPSKRGPSIG